MTYTLSDAIQEFQQSISKMIPEEIKSQMLKAKEELKSSGIATGLTVGTIAPNFKLKDPTDQDISLYEELEKGPVILTFYRGTWCPYCNLELRAYQNFVSPINELGAQVIAVSPQTPDHSLSMKEKNECSFHVLSDPNGQVATQYNLLHQLPDYLVEIYKQMGGDIPAHNGEDSWTLPVPGTFIIDKDKTICLASVDADYTKRAEPSEVVEKLKSLSK